MTQPKFTPIMEQNEVREVQRLGVPAAWSPHRPGESRPTPKQVQQAGLGIPGPDQGYALELATHFEDRLALEPDERSTDVMAGAVAIAMRRASIFGRAPIRSDIEIALGLFGYLSRDEPAPPPADLIALRRERFSGAEHGYWVRRSLAESIPVTTLRLSVEALIKKLDEEPGIWRELVGA